MSAGDKNGYFNCRASRLCNHLDYGLEKYVFFFSFVTLLSSIAAQTIKGDTVHLLDSEATAQA
jgi:hypothetical protein